MALRKVGGRPVSRLRRRVVLTIASIVIMLLVGGGMTAASVAILPGFVVSWGAGCTFSGGTVGGVTVTNTRTGDVVELGAGQLQNAAVILDVARELELPPAAGKIALMTALQESTLRMLANPKVPESLKFPHEGTGTDHDSVNVFQQRPHWGALSELMDLSYAARAFFGGATGPNHGSPRGLLDIPGWEEKGLGEAAQAVQVSAYPDRYDAWADAADALISTIAEGTVCEAGAVDAQGDGRNGWGGFENGRIPQSLLSPIPWSTKHLLRQDATAAFTALNQAWVARFGSSIIVNDAYRDLEGQVAAREHWCGRGNCQKAAIPGESNHGWGLAIDIQVSFNTEKYRWLKQNAPSYGWVHPAWAEPDGSNPESWHWEFAGK